MEANEAAADDPSTLQDSPWFIVVKVANLDDDLANLMDAKKAEEYFTGEIERAKGEGLLE
jgi:glycine cleavage system H lipoate-binding protein